MADPKLALPESQMGPAERLLDVLLNSSAHLWHNRFITVCDAITLQVFDAGICLVDHHDEHRGDEELTLESLPSAIHEAMDLGVLVITRR